MTDNGERTAPSLAGNIARGWERLLAGIGLNRREELPADRNVLLTAGDRQELLRRSATAIRQAQQNASPTCTKPREDPSYGDTVRTATNAPTPKTPNASKASDIHTRHNPTPKTNQS